MGCVHSRLSKIFRPSPVREQPAAARDNRPTVDGGHAHRQPIPEPARGAVSEHVPRLPRPPPRTPPQEVPNVPVKPRYSPPHATPSKVYQQPGGYRFGDSQRAIVESDGEPSVVDKLPDDFSPPVAVRNHEQHGATAAGPHVGTERAGALRGAESSLELEKTQGSESLSAVTATTSTSTTGTPTTSAKSLISEEEKSLFNNVSTGTGWSSVSSDELTNDFIPKASMVEHGTDSVAFDDPPESTEKEAAETVIDSVQGAVGKPDAQELNDAQCELLRFNGGIKEIVVDVVLFYATIGDLMYTIVICPERCYILAQHGSEATVLVKCFPYGELKNVQPASSGFNFIDFELQKLNEACSEEYAVPCKSLQAAARLCDKVLRAKHLYEAKQRLSESHAQSSDN